MVREGIGCGMGAVRAEAVRDADGRCSGPLPTALRRGGRSLEGYSGVVLKMWGVKVVVAVRSEESSSVRRVVAKASECVSPLRLDGASRMVGRRLACRDAAGSRARHLTGSSHLRVW